jgi:phage terminase large subunit-like protein
MTTETLPVKTAPPVNGKDLITIITGNPAPRHDGKNLLITIEVGPVNAVFHCESPEHVGNHKQRHALFCANKHCWLMFIENSAFTEDYLELQIGEKVPAQVSNNTQNGSTRYVIRVGAETADPVRMATTVVDAKHGPVIVVP